MSADLQGDGLDIPEFLRRPLDPQAKRAISRQRNRDRKIPWRGWSGRPALRWSKNLEPAGLEILREIRREEAKAAKAKKAARKRR